MATNSTIDASTVKLRSGRVLETWQTAQARLRHKINMVGNNIKFEFTDPPDQRFIKPMSDVFNIPELLEHIFLDLRPGFLLQNAQKICRGFKETIDGSPTFRKRAAFAIHVQHDPNDGHDVTFSYGLMPRYLQENRRGPRPPELQFFFAEQKRLFEDYRAMERFRRLRVFDMVPQRFWVNRHHSPDSTEFWEVEASGDAVTFGEIFDVVAGLVSGKKAVKTLDITWSTLNDEPDSKDSVYG
jgi:hypothetical protein